MAAFAGGSPDVALRLAVAMLAIQSAIGAANDLVDAPADRSVKPGKPIAAGLVAPAAARAVALVGLAAGFLLAASVSASALGLAAAGSAAGLAYDLRLKGTPASWLPFAIGIPLLPLFAWVGATGSAPTPVLILAGLAVPAGAAIAVANALPDLERDTAAGVASAATARGRVRAGHGVAALQALVGASALTSFAVLASGRGAIPPAAVAGLVGSCLALGGGVVLSRRPSIAARQRGWEVQALASGGIAASWLGGLVAAGRF